MTLPWAFEAKITLMKNMFICDEIIKLFSNRSEVNVTKATDNDINDTL